MGFNHGLFLGSRQLTILIPWPPFLTLRLWDAIHSLTSLEMCQEALSQINTHTFLPVAASFSEHHERKRVVIGDRLLHQAQGLARFAPAVEGGPGQAAPPGLVQETYDPVGAAVGQTDQPLAPPFFLAYSGSGLLIQRLARRQRTPRRSRVARTVSPLTRLSVSPSSKLTSAARSSVHKLVSLPTFLGSWCSISRKVSASSGSKAL